MPRKVPKKLNPAPVAAQSNFKKYKTLSNVRLNKKLYVPGRILTLDVGAAEYLMKQGALEEIAEK